jgi:hypothetical protein
MSGGQDEVGEGCKPQSFFKADRFSGLTFFRADLFQG